MGKLYTMLEQIDEQIARRGLDEHKVKGEIGMQCGFFLCLIFESTPDDPAKIAKLSEVATQVLGTPIRA